MNCELRTTAHAPVSRKKGEADVTQSDLAMNLFMVLMVMLATLAASTAVVTTLGFKVRMESEPSRSEHAPLALVRGWAPVQPIASRLVVRDGLVARLDLDRLAEAFANNARFLPEMNFSEQLAEDRDPSAYKIELAVGVQTPLPTDILAWRAPVSDFAKAANGEAPMPPGFAKDLDLFEHFDIFVYPGHEVSAWDVVDLLFKARKRYRIYFVARAGFLEFERASVRFTFEDMYK